MVSITVRIRVDDQTPPELRQEAMEAAQDDLRRYIHTHGPRRPETIQVTLEGDEWVLTYDSDAGEIVRIRRITGYLSRVDQFVPSKAAELKDRRPHM